MRQTAVVLALATGVVGGCLTGKSGRDAPLPPTAGHVAAAAAAEVVYLDVALVEQPLGEAFVTHDLWELGDEQGNLELKPLLEANGLRVCQIGGQLPGRLQALLSSRRSCADPRRMQGEPGRATAVPVGPARDACRFRFAAAGAVRVVDVAQARCVLQVTPSFPDEGHVQLRFAPQVKHGVARVTPRVENDPGGPLRWAMEARDQVEEFGPLCWECTLGPNELAVVGPRVDRPGTLGEVFFTAGDGPDRVQWLLVVRASRVPLGPAVDEALTQAPPLALQAGWGAPP